MMGDDFNEYMNTPRNAKLVKHSDYTVLKDIRIFRIKDAMNVYLKSGWQM